MRKKIGNCMVDAGCIMLVDPCYVLPDERQTGELFSEEHPKGDAALAEARKHLPIRATYGEFLKALRKDDSVLNRGLEFHGGVIVESGYGDGEYAVYANYNKDGRITSVTISFR